MADTKDMTAMLVAKKERIAENIFLFEFRSRDNQPLQPFKAGAHLKIKVPSGVMRQYSLCNSPSETDRYQIAVKREEEGRGGSRSMVDEVSVGDSILIGVPKNDFGLAPEAKKFILIAGGIGITPMVAMAKELSEEGVRGFKLIYLAKTPEQAAFAKELKDSDFSGSVVIHHSYGDPEKAYDLWKILEKPVAGTHIYCCGPDRLMASVKDMAGHWPTSAVHFESFGVNAKPRAEDVAFEVKLTRSQKSITVAADVTLLDALRAVDVYVSSSCESGTCGSCKLTYSKGEVDHRDLVLLPEEKDKCIIVCVSRAKDSLELDL